MARIEGNYLVSPAAAESSDERAEMYQKISGIREITISKNITSGVIEAIWFGDGHANGQTIDRKYMRPSPDEFIAQLKSAMGLTSKGGKRKTRRTI